MRPAIAQKAVEIRAPRGNQQVLQVSGGAKTTIRRSCLGDVVKAMRHAGWHIDHVTRRDVARLVARGEARAAGQDDVDLVLACG